MWTAKWILDTYEGGNETVRSDTYMFYRELRHYFDEIEARPEITASRRAAPEARRPASAWLNQHLRFVKG